MNAGTRKGGVSGFTLDSLLTLGTTKGVDKKTTLMDYLAAMVEKKGGEKLLSFQDDLGAMQAARRFVFSDAKGEVARMKASLTALRREAAAELADLEVPKPGSAGAGAGPGAGAGAGAASSASSSSPLPSKADRASALSAMLAKRLGGAPPAAAPAKAGGKPATAAGAGAGSGAADAPHPCSPGTRKAFATKLQAFAASADSQLADVQAMLDVVVQRSVSLAHFFAEEPDMCPPERVFDVLSKFVQMFAASMRGIKQKQEAERRKQRRASVTSGGSRPRSTSATRRK